MTPMGFIKNLITPAPIPVVTNALADIILADALQNDYGTKQALAIGAAFRARMMNADIPASLPVYADGDLIPDTADATMQIILSLQDHGDAYLKLDGSGWFTVLKYQDVRVAWNFDQSERVYTHRVNGPLRIKGMAKNLVVLSVNRGASDLTGVGWMESERLQGIYNAQKYAAEYFANSGQPTGTVNVPGVLTKDEADKLKEQWIEARVVRSPAVLSSGMTWTGSSFNMTDSQWTEGHLVDIGDISSLSGVPSSFLSYSPAGSSLVYNSGADLWRQYYSQTLAPTYISRIQQAWSQITGKEVLFDPEQLLIASLQERSQAASVLVAAGYDPATVADVVGLPPMAAAKLETRSVEVVEDVA